MAQNGGIQHLNRQEHWYFTKEELERTPSIRHGMDKAKELNARQHAASFIQDMGLRLKVTQVVINTSVVYMHRFYMHHSFKVFHRHQIATACIFLACKIEEQPRRIFDIVKAFLTCKGQSTANLERRSTEYLQQEERIKNNELLLLETLGFEVTIDHPHQYLVRGTQLVKVSKDLAQISYFMAHNSLLLTTMCLEYKPQTVACVCINLSCRWKDIVIPLSSENKHWSQYIDGALTQEKLTKLTMEFIDIIGSCPSRLKNRIEEYCKNRAAPSQAPPSSSNRAAPSQPPPPPPPPPGTSSLPIQTTRNAGMPEAKRVRYSNSETGEGSQEFPKHHAPSSSSQPPILQRSHTQPHPAASLATPNSGHPHPLHQGCPPVLKRDNPAPKPSYPSTRPFTATQPTKEEKPKKDGLIRYNIPHKIPHRDDSKRT